MFAEWILAHLGPERSAELLVRLNKPLKIKRYEKAIANHYREEYEAMKRLRAKGETGYMQFSPWRQEIDL